MNLEIALEMSREDEVYKNHFDYNYEEHYKNGVLTKEKAAGFNHCTENHFFKALPKWIVKQLQQPNLQPVIFKFK